MRSRFLLKDTAATLMPQHARTWGKILLGLGAVVGLLLIGRQVGGVVPQFAAWVTTLGWWGPLVFIIGYALAVVALVPGSLLTLAAGAVFGLGQGVAYVFVAAVLGSSAAFLIARYVARSAVERRLANNPRFAALDTALGAQGWKIVLLLRLSPVFPFTMLNYSLGLTKVRFGDYLLASVGMLPGTLLYVYSGKLAGDVASLAGGAAVERGLGLLPGAGPGAGGDTRGDHARHPYGAAFPQPDHRRVNPPDHHLAYVERTVERAGSGHLQKVLLPARVNLNRNLADLDLGNLTAATAGLHDNESCRLQLGQRATEIGLGAAGPFPQFSHRLGFAVTNQ